MLSEDSYGRRKRLDFVAAAIRANGSRRILDVGCGTGANLTIPLAELFHDCQFLGTDVDTGSIEVARQAEHPANIQFATMDALDNLNGTAPFDCVIASEVLEHVEDPVDFLAKLRAWTVPEGRLILTVPNGYGPFEWCALFEALAHISGLQRLARGVKRRLVKSPPTDHVTAAPTLAISPHINFFSRSALITLFQTAGLEVRGFRATTFLCGYGIDSILKGSKIIAWNAAIADRLPPWCASDWMFELIPNSRHRPGIWRPNSWGRFRRRVNCRRWGLQ